VRYELWRSAALMWRDHFWFGVGPGHFDHRFREYRPEAVQRRPDRAHNEYLNTLADWGVVGALIICCLAGRARARGCPGVGDMSALGDGIQSNLSNKFAFVLGASLGLLALLVHSVVDYNITSPLTPSSR